MTVATITTNFEIYERMEKLSAIIHSTETTAKEKESATEELTELLLILAERYKKEN